MVLVWEPITDLPEDWSSLSDGELDPLLQFWKDQRADLEQSGALAEFSKRLNREWSIETGQIEGVYDLDRGITQTLIERGIDADLIGNHPGQKPAEQIAAIIQDHADALEGLFQFVKGDRPISKSYIHELHAALLRHQDTSMMVDQFGNLFESKLLKGKYKERPNNPKKSDGSMHQYCPPEQVDSEMERLLALHTEHEKKGMPVEVGASWLHHRFTQIHPYQDGNGRVARALASLLFIKAGWFPVVVTRETRARYIDALEVGDEGDLRSLIGFFTYLQKRALFGIMQVVADAQNVRTVEDAIAAAKRVLSTLGKGAQIPHTWLVVKETADQLMRFAEVRLSEITTALKNEIGKTRAEVRFRARYQTGLPLPQDLPYVPSTDDYEQTRVLSIGLHAEEYARIEVHAHAIGSRFRGLIGFVCVFNDLTSPQLASEQNFQVNYAESPESAERRFRPWLEESLVNALTMWRKSL
jgi:fido (protein-threonine AMPylation protein)